VALKTNMICHNNEVKRNGQKFILLTSCGKWIEYKKI